MTLGETLTAIMRKTRNFHEVGKLEQEFSIVNGSIVLPSPFMHGQWVAIEGSVLNNGVYRLDGASGEYKLTDDKEIILTDETFRGIVWGLAVPRDLLSLAKRVQAFNIKEGERSSVTSETVVGLHSWAKGTKNDGSPITWETVFADDLVQFNNRMHRRVGV